MKILSPHRLDVARKIYSAANKLSFEDWLNFLTAMVEAKYEAFDAE